MTGDDDYISRIEAAVSAEYGNWRVTIYSSLAQDIRALLDRLKAAEAENEQLRDELRTALENTDA